MKIISSLLIIIILAGFLACREKSAGPSEKGPGSTNTRILDSIKKLDSLSLSLRVQNDKLSVVYAKTALTLARSSDSPQALIKAYNAMGNAYSTRHQDSSYYYYNLGLKLSDSINEVKEKPYLLYDVAMIYLNTFNYKTAMILLDSCIEIGRAHV